MGSLKEFERRKSTRVTIFQEMFFGGKSSRRADDISAEGMFISTPETFMKGSVIDLKFRLLNANSPISVKGEVRFVDEGVGMGIRFIDLRPEDRQQIENLIKKF